jgi:hypothetical protein
MTAPWQSLQNLKGSVMAGRLCRHPLRADADIVTPSIYITRLSANTVLPLSVRGYIQYPVRRAPSPTFAPRDPSGLLPSRAALFRA